MKNINEEYRIKDDGSIEVFSDRVTKDEARKKYLQDIASGKLKVRNLDKDPIRKKPLKKDTEYSVQEIAKTLYDKNVKMGGINLQGKYESAKAFEDYLRTHEKTRKNADSFMIKISGPKGKLIVKKEVKPVKDVDIFDVAKRAMESKNPAVKAVIGDIKDIESLRRMMMKNPKDAAQLAKLLGNINEEENNDAQIMADFKVDCKQKLAIFKRILAKLENQVNNYTDDPEFVASCFKDFAEDVESEVDDLESTYDFF